MKSSMPLPPSCWLRFRDRAFKTVVLVCSAFVPFTLVSCSNFESNGGSNELPSTSTVTVTSTVESLQKNALDWYRTVIENPENYPVNVDVSFVPTGSYSYSLVETPGEELPSLLLMVHSEGLSLINVFTVDDGRLVQINGAFIDGETSGDRQRVSVKGSRSGVGLYQVEHHTTSGEGFSTLYDFEGDALYPVSSRESYNASTEPSDHYDIEWTNISDHSVLEGRLGLRGTSSIQSHTSAEPGAEAPEAEDSDIQQFTGVVYEKTAQELMDGGETPNGEPWDELHIVMELDNPRDVTAVNYGTNTVTRFVDEVALISDENGYDWSQHIGQRITISVVFDQMRFPSDASLPLGALRIFDFTQIE